MEVNVPRGSFKIVKGKWYSSDGQPLRDDEKDLVKQEVYQELDKELANHGFEGFVKVLIKMVLAVLVK